MSPISDVQLLDCMEGMAQYPDNFFDLAIVDPPYGIGESQKQGKGVRNSVIYDKRNGISTPVKTFHKAKDWDKEHPSQAFFDKLFRVAKKHIIFGENYICFNQKILSSGRIFWDKVNGGNDFSDGELMWTNCIKSVRQIEFMWNGMIQGKSIQNGRIQNGNKKGQQRIHPSQKPIAIYEWLLKTYAKSGDKILDTHLGSGSSRIAAYKLGFDFWGFEIDPDYFRDAEKRFKESIAMPLFDTAPEVEQLQLFEK